MFVGHYGPGFAAKRLGDWTEAFQICNIHAGGRLPKVIPLPFRLSSSTSWVVLRNGLFSARAFREVGLGNAMDSQLSDDGQTGSNSLGENRPSVEVASLASRFELPHRLLTMRSRIRGHEPRGG